MSGVAYEPKVRAGRRPAVPARRRDAGRLLRGPGHRELSLLRLAAAEGFRALAVDRPDGGVSLSADDRLELFWGPHRLYPPESLDRERRPTAPVPDTEVAESAEWPALFATMAPSVSVPVLYTIADHERWWDVGPAALAEFCELLTSSAVVEIEWQADAGHNISLGWTARAYHRRVVAFAAACCRLARA